MKPCNIYKDHSVVYVCKGKVNCGERAGGEVCKTREKWIKLISLSLILPFLGWLFLRLEFVLTNIYMYTVNSCMYLQCSVKWLV